MPARKMRVCLLIVLLIPEQKSGDGGRGERAEVGEVARGSVTKKHGEKFDFYSKYKEMPLKSAELCRAPFGKIENLKAPQEMVCLLS